MGSVLGFTDEELAEGAGGLTPVSKVLNDFGNEMQEGLRQSIQNKGLTDTFNLWQSIDFSTTIFGQTLTFQLKLADYYDFINKGVRGKGGTKKDGSSYRVKATDSPYFFKSKRPPLDDIKFWAKRKGINPFAAQESIFRKGIRKTEFYDDVVTPRRLTQLKSDLSKALKEEVRVFVRSTAKGIIGGTLR